MERDSRASRVTLSRSFLTWLTVIVAIGFAVSVGASWLLQTRLSNESTEELLRTNIEDVRQSIQDASDENLLELTYRVLASVEGVSYWEQSLQLEAGDLLFLYTDGVPETSNEQEDMYGEDRLTEVLSADYGVGDEVCRDVCSAVKRDVDAFVQDAPRFDDITMLCLCYCGEGCNGDA